MCYHLNIWWPVIEQRANLQKVHMILPTLRFSSKKARVSADAQRYTLRVNLWNLGVYQKHLTLEWHLVKLAPAGLGLPQGAVFSRRERNHSRGLSPQHRPPLHAPLSAQAAAAALGMTFPACLCLALRA